MFHEDDRIYPVGNEFLHRYICQLKRLRYCEPWRIVLYCFSANGAFILFGAKGRMTKIIAFEGIDGTGKTVQMERMQQRLAERGFSVKTLSFPVYTSFFGGEVGKLLSAREGVRADDVDGKSMALWFALDRFEALRDYSLADIDILLINRYVLSNAVYQSIRDIDLGKPDLLDFVFSLEHEHFGIPRADAYVVLDVLPDAAASNVDKKGFREYVGNMRDVYEALPDIQSRARLKYMEYAERLNNVFLIPCMEDGQLMPIDRIGARIDQALRSIIFEGEL